MIRLSDPLGQRHNPRPTGRSRVKFVYRDLCACPQTCPAAIIKGNLDTGQCACADALPSGNATPLPYSRPGAVIGLNLHVSDIGKYVRLYLTQAGVKFVIAPLVALLMVSLFHLEAHDLPGKIVLTQAFMPAAIYSVLLSNIFGLNARLASAMFVVNTLVFLVIVLPLLAVFAL